MLNRTREKRGFLYATFYSKYDDAIRESAVGNIEDPFDLDQIGNGYHSWSRSETQLLILVVVLIITILLIGILISLDCIKGHRRNIVHSLCNCLGRQSNSQQNRSATPESYKAPPVSILAPPPYSSNNEIV